MTVVNLYFEPVEKKKEGKNVQVDDYVKSMNLGALHSTKILVAESNYFRM